MFSALCSQLKDVESALDIHILMGEAATLDILERCGISDEMYVSLLSSSVFTPGIQQNWVGGCGLGMVNSCIKAFLHSIKWWVTLQSRCWGKH